MNNEMVRRACHAIGMDNKQPFYKYGEKHFISYRNYSVSNRLGMSILTKWNLKDWQNETVENSQLPII